LHRVVFVFLKIRASSAKQKRLCNYFNKPE